MLPRVSRWLLWLLDEHKGCRSENIGHPPPEALKARLCASARKKVSPVRSVVPSKFTRLAGTTRSIGTAV